MLRVISASKNGSATSLSYSGGRSNCSLVKAAFSIYSSKKSIYSSTRKWKVLSLAFFLNSFPSYSRSEYYEYWDMSISHSSSKYYFKESKLVIWLYFRSKKSIFFKLSSSIFISTSFSSSFLLLTILSLITHVLFFLFTKSPYSSWIRIFYFSSDRTLIRSSISFNLF